MSSALLEIDGNTSGIAASFASIRADAALTEKSIIGSMQRAAKGGEAVYRTSGRAMRDESAKTADAQERDARKALMAYIRAGEQKVAAAKMSADALMRMESMATQYAEGEAQKRGLSAAAESRLKQTMLEQLTRTHEANERTRTLISRREDAARVASARAAMQAIGALANDVGRAHGATQASRQTTAEVNDTLNSAFGEAGASAGEAGRLRRRAWDFAQREGIDPGQLSTALQHTQQQFSSLAGANPREREAALDRALGAAQLAHDTQSDPEQVMRLQGALGDAASPEALRGAIGITRRGGVELGSLSSQNLGTIRAQMAAAVANLRRTNPNATEGDANRAQIDAFTETLSTLEVLAPRGLEGRGAGTAVRQLGSALHDPRTQGALLARIRNEFGRGSTQEEQLFDHGALRQQFQGVEGGNEFGRAITAIAGGDPDRIRSLLGRGTRTGDRGEVLHANQREELAKLAGQDSRGRTGFDALLDIRAGAADVNAADVARTRAIVQGSDSTNLTRQRIRGMRDVRDPSWFQRASDAVEDFGTSHPLLSTALTGGAARMLYQGGGKALAGRALTGLAGLGTAAVALPALAFGGAALTYTDSKRADYNEDAMLRQWHQTHVGQQHPAAMALPGAPAPTGSHGGPVQVSLTHGDHAAIGQQTAAALRANPPHVTTSPTDREHDTAGRHLTHHR